MFCRDLGQLPIERVSLPMGALSGYALRRQTDPSHVSTFEAVARALGIVESVTLEQKLEVVMNMFVQRASEGRYGDAYSGKLNGPMTVLPRYSTDSF